MSKQLALIEETSAKKSKSKASKQAKTSKSPAAVEQASVRPVVNPKTLPDDHVSFFYKDKPAYSTLNGSMYHADSKEMLAKLPDNSVDLVVTSPPYALHFKKEYGNVTKEEYKDWLVGFGREIYRVLKPEGSFVLNIGGSYNAGSPTRSLYHFKTLISLCEDVGFHLAQECFWMNPAKLPSPAEWVTVRRIRIKDSIEYVWWLSKTPFPKATNKNVLTEYSDDMKRLLKKGYRTKTRPSGHVITAKFNTDHGGSIPSNVLERGNNESNSEYIKLCAEYGLKAHPARFPAALPEFYIKMLTDPGDIVIDPFGGSNTTGSVAEQLNRRWLAFELEERYVDNSRLRFGVKPLNPLK